MLIIQLVAPTKIQVATFLGKYTLLKTAVDFEIAVSNNDANLSTDDSNNQEVRHQTTVAFKKWIADAFANYQFIQKNLDLSSVSTLLNLIGI
jgi:hypothetical protein